MTTRLFILFLVGNRLEIVGSVNDVALDLLSDKDDLGMILVEFFMEFRAMLESSRVESSQCQMS